MAREITAGVLLKLKDQFSSQIRGAGISVQGFADKAVGVAEKVNKAFSGVAGTMGTLGVSIGTLSAVKSTIDLDDRMVRLGLTANASAAEINDLKRQIFETAQMPDIKLDTDSIISGLEVIMTKVGDLRFVEDNVRNIALAIQASGESGDAMGAVFSEFAKFGYTMEEILPLMDDLIAQGDQGAFTFGEFAKNAPAVFSAYSSIGTTPEHIRKANAAMQILQAGTKSADIAVTALNSTMAELSEPDKQKKLRMLGIAVRDSNGNFRDFNDIMFDIVARAEKMGNADFFGTIFGSISMKAVRAYMTQGERMYDSLVNLGDTAGLLEQKSVTMANTLKSNIQNLQTAFLSFADTNLTGPLQKLTDLLNKLAEDPEKIEAGIRGIAIAIGGLAAVKIGAGIISFVGSLNSLKSGGKLNVDGLANAGGGAGIPVHVTNWGGTAGSSMMPGVENGSPAAGSVGSPAQPALLNNKPPLESARTAVGNITGRQYATGAASAGIGAALVEIPQMISELHAIDQDEALTTKERGEAKGGAIGDATGSIVGAAAGGAAGIAAGAAVGAAVGSVVPVLGTAVGALVGAGVGALGMWLGGKAGRAVGTAIGGAVSGDDETASQNLESIYNSSVAMYPGITPASPDIAYYNAVTHYPGIAHNATTVINPVSVNDLIITPQGQFNTHPDDFIIAMKDPTALVNAGLSVAYNRYQTFQETPGIVQHNTSASNVQTVNDLIVTPQGQFSTHPDDYIIAMKKPAALVNAGLPAAHNHYQPIQEAPGVIQHNTNISNAQTVNDPIITLQNQFSALPDDYGIAMQDPAALVDAGLPAVNNRYQTFQETSGVVQYDTNISNVQMLNDLSITPQDQFSALLDDYGIAMQNLPVLVNAGLPVAHDRYQTFYGAPGIIPHNINISSAKTANDLIVTPQGQFSTHPDDYIIAMKNPETLVNSEIHNEMRSVERVPPAIPPVIVEGEIELRSELTIDDKGYRLRQSVGKNTTPYKFAVGSAKNARLIQ